MFHLKNFFLLFNLKKNEFRQKENKISVKFINYFYSCKSFLYLLKVELSFEMIFYFILYTQESLSFQSCIKEKEKKKVKVHNVNLPFDWAGTKFTHWRNRTHTHSHINMVSDFLPWKCFPFVRVKWMNELYALIYLECES